MADLKLIDIVREFLKTAHGKEISYNYLRAELKIDPASPAWEGLRKVMERLVKEKAVKPAGRSGGVFKVIIPVKPVRVFVPDRERKPPFKLFFPRDFNTGMEMCFAEDIVIREGDIVTIGGVSNYGKTCLALNFCGENIEYGPVLMGNEYTTRVGDTDEYEPTPRFLNRLDAMDWVKWTNGAGEDRFTLLPVKEDYAEHIVKNKINIIDWINLDANQLYNISKVMDDIKSEVGRGVAIPVLQKGEGAATARGGQFVKDFTDCELNIDKFTERESMLTIGKVKESTKSVTGRKFAFGILHGVKIINFREIVQCPQCFGKGWRKAGNSSIPCDGCSRTGMIDK